MIVLDASALVELVLGTTAGDAVSRGIRGQAAPAPAHLEVEVTGAIRRAVVRGLLSDREGRMAFDEARSLPLTRWGVGTLLQRSCELRHSHSTADALYVALAEGLGVPLITCDRRLARSTGHHAVIRVP